ncbi:MAG: ribosomal protein [Gammaproteobacteria bacterium]|nr:ribosomal protein [Gammaproteobacteria bacterium]
MMLSRMARRPLEIQKGIDVAISQGIVNVKGQKGQLQHRLPKGIDVLVEEGHIQVKALGNAPNLRVLAGTTRALLNNLLIGVSKGYERKLILVGVGYRAQLQGDSLNLALGFSHPVTYKAPQGISFEAPSQTEILVKGIDKQLVGQVAADIRAFRPPEPYKGKGIRYADEKIVLKETKKK